MFIPEEENGQKIESQNEGLEPQGQAEGSNPPAETSSDSKDEKTPEEIANSEKIDSLLERGNSEDAEFTQQELDFLKENGVKIETGEDSNFFTEVETLTGNALEVDYGDIDPNSAQGVVKYLDAHKVSVESNFEQLLKEKAPLSYQAMLIENGGGNPAEYFISEEDDSIDYSKQSVSKNNIEDVKSFIRKDYTSKGMDLETINTLIDSLEDKGKLLDAGKNSLEHLAGSQKQKREAVVENARIAQQQEYDTMSAFSNSIEESIKTGIAGSFNIPQADLTKFQDYVLDRVVYQDGSFYSSKEIKAEDISKELGSLFFEYKGGNIDSLVQSRVKSENVRTLKLKSSSQTGKVLGEKQKHSKGFIPFGDLT